jgi:hypothetical protein
MNLSIEFQESVLKDLIEKYVQISLRYTEYNPSDLAKQIAARTQSSLASQVKELDFDTLVMETAKKYIHGIVEDVVKRKIADLARASVKELKDRGELL